MYFACIWHCSNALSHTNKRCHSSKSLFAPPCNVVFHFHLLLGSGRLYWCRPHPFHQDLLIGHKSLHGPYSLLNHMEHCVELYCYYLLVHPNVPCLKKQSPVISFAKHHLPLFICVLLVPEYILAWAIRQFFRAQKIAKENKGDFSFGLHFYW